MRVCIRKHILDTHRHPNAQMQCRCTAMPLCEPPLETKQQLRRWCPAKWRTATPSQSCTRQLRRHDAESNHTINSIATLSVLYCHVCALPSLCLTPLAHSYRFGEDDVKKGYGARFAPRPQAHRKHKQSDRQRRHGADTSHARRGNDGTRWPCTVTGSIARRKHMHGRTAGRHTRSRVWRRQSAASPTATLVERLWDRTETARSVSRQEAISQIELLARPIPILLVSPSLSSLPSDGWHRDPR